MCIIYSIDNYFAISYDTYTDKTNTQYIITTKKTIKRVDLFIKKLTPFYNHYDNKTLSMHCTLAYINLSSKKKRSLYKISQFHFNNQHQSTSELTKL